MRTSKVQVILLAVLIPLGALYLYVKASDGSLAGFFIPDTPMMHIGEVPIRVDIANTREELIQGLSGKDNLGAVNGLLFVFPETKNHAIWMKDMNFPIDIVWISEDLVVINVERNVSPETYPTTFKPNSPARYALETEAGFTNTVGIQKGQKVWVPKNHLDN